MCVRTASLGGRIPFEFRISNFEFSQSWLVDDDFCRFFKTGVLVVAVSDDFERPESGHDRAVGRLDFVGLKRLFDSDAIVVARLDDSASIYGRIGHCDGETGLELHPGKRALACFEGCLDRGLQCHNQSSHSNHEDTERDHDLEKSEAESSFPFSHPIH